MSKYHTYKQNGVDGLNKFKFPLIGSVFMVVILIVLLDYQFSIVKPLQAQADTQDVSLLQVDYVFTEPKVEIDTMDKNRKNRIYLAANKFIEEHTN